MTIGKLINSLSNKLKFASAVEGRLIPTWICMGKAVVNNSLLITPALIKWRLQTQKSSQSTSSVKVNGRNMHKAFLNWLKWYLLSVLKVAMVANYKYIINLSGFKDKDIFPSFWINSYISLWWLSRGCLHPGHYNGKSTEPCWWEDFVDRVREECMLLLKPSIGKKPITWACLSPRKTIISQDAARRRKVAW